MIFDNLIEADFISQSVYSYTGARPNTLPSSHMRHGHAEHAAVGRSTAGLTTRNLKLLFRFQEIQRPPLYECAARREAGRFLPYRESFYLKSSGATTVFVFAAESQRRILRLYNAARASRRRDRRRDSRATSSDRCTQQHLRYSRQEGFEPGQQQQAVQTRQPGEQEYSCHGSRSLTLAQRHLERASDHASSEFERGRHGL